MSNGLMVLDGPVQLPAHLQGQNLGVTAGLLATVGAGGNRIGLKGSRFRLVVNGKEEAVIDENYLDVIIVGVLPHISRMYYEGEYQQDVKMKPTCFSEDGNAPPADLPTKQADRCEGCKWNEKGSKIVNGQKMKACGFFQRLVVMLANDPENRYFKLDVKSQGIFGESHAKVNKYNVRDYGKALGNRGIDASVVITRLSFDTDSSVPKLLFSPVGFVEPNKFDAVKEAVASEAVKNMLQITMSTVDLSTEEDAPAAASEPVTPAAPVKQEEAKPAPVAPAPPAPTPAAEQPKQYKPVKEKLGEFTVQQYLDTGWTKEMLIAEGMIVEYVPEPAAPPAPPKPPAAPKAPPAPPAPPAAAQQPQIEDVAMPAPTPPKPAAAAPAAVQEVTTDKELQDLIAGLM